MGQVGSIGDEQEASAEAIARDILSFNRPVKRGPNQPRGNLLIEGPGMLYHSIRHLDGQLHTPGNNTMRTMEFPHDSAFTDDEWKKLAERLSA